MPIEMTDALRKARSEAGKIGGAKNKGRGHGRAATKTMTIRENDYNVIAAVVETKGISFAEFLHTIAVDLCAKHPELKPLLEAPINRVK